MDYEDRYAYDEQDEYEGYYDDREVDEDDFDGDGPEPEDDYDDDFPMELEYDDWKCYQEDSMDY